MRWLTLVIVGVLVLAGCSSSNSSTMNTTATQKPAQGASGGQAPAVDGIRVMVDGKAFDITTGDVKVTRERASGTSLLHIGRNASPSALTGGNGVLLQLQTSPGKEGFSTNDVAVVTFTVWKGVEFSYVSMGAIPGQPVKGLVLSDSAGKLSGSFEADLNGTLGKVKGRVEFGVALPK
ncbi:MAG: hypothetical protein HYX94_04000 [Chloroflexi bacterium]|nr:hypothetical protein [Chloroflexota bacterium]